MIENILSGLLAVMLSAAPTATQYKEPAMKVAELKGTVPSDSLIWVVKPQESLSGIAEVYYGNTQYWTTLWNDNDWIENPSDIKENQVLKLRFTTPERPDILKDSLARKLTTPPSTAQPVYTAYTVPVAQAATATIPTPTSAPAAVYRGGPLNDAQITFLGNCEAGMNPARNSGNGYYGAFQFSYGTWTRMNTGYERADLAPLDVQIAAVQQLLSRSSIYTQFPACARKMQAAGLL